jgi:ABC-type multidrug transport system fused ATPase/permease subunit
MPIISRLLTLKTYLPLNGDWLFPTLSLPQSIEEHDLSKLYANRESVLRDLPPYSLDKEQYEFLLQEVDRYAETVFSRAEHIRDKAKTLVGLGSFAAAVSVGILALLANRIPYDYHWISYVSLVLVLMFIVQFALSLVRFVSVLTREEYVDVSPKTVLGMFSEEDGVAIDYKKQLISERIALAHVNQQLITARANKLIAGQVGLRYGLLYGFAMILGGLLLLSFVRPDSKPLEQTVPMQLQEIRSEVRNIALVMASENDKAITRSSEDLKSLLQEVKTLSLRLQEIETSLRSVIETKQEAKPSKAGQSTPTTNEWREKKPQK